jgi:hydroxymethylbilane synthase
MVDPNRKVIRVGARGSRLSLVQADSVVRKLSSAFPDRMFKLEIIRTTGDLHQTAPLSSWGGRGVFVKELERSLLEDGIDIAVHSAKDLPADLPDGLILAAVSEREEVEDALVSVEGQQLMDLPSGVKVATGSPRRKAQILRCRKDLQTVDVRGNIDTRLRKMTEAHFEALVIARAGLRRLGMEDRIAEVLSPERFLPAPGQGAIALECRRDDDDARSLLEIINHRESFRALEAERSLLKTLGAGCSVPVAAWARPVNGCLTLDAAVYHPLGDDLVAVRRTIGSEESARVLGREAALDLIASGAYTLIK